VTRPAADIGRLSDPCDVWALTRAVSPRPVVRVADVDACGEVLNTYTGGARIDGERPCAPWAVYLTDGAGQFRLLAFDLDVAKGDPVADAATLCGWLTAAGLPHVVAASGPGGGRHVWLGLAEAVEATVVDTLARLVRAQLPSLDIAPLANPVTGCVRPPGAPHRHGGTSIVLAGQLCALTAPVVTGADVGRLIDMLAAGHRPQRSDPVELGTPLPVDGAGRLHLPGLRRDLPVASAAALGRDGAGTDANTVLWTVLIGAAGARWRCADIAALTDRAPGLEHVRTQGQGPGRVRRTRSGREARAVLARQWDRAVAWVATHPRAAIVEDPSFEPRAAGLVALIEHTQTRADAGPGRWSGPGGPADRRVLDALCALSLQGMCTVVEADIRRLGLLCGIGRETARTALGRLCGDGWISRVRPGEGPRAAFWKLPAPLSTPSYLQGRSQAVPRPLGAGTADRTRWLRLLETRLSAVAHDVFTTAAGGLGHATGQVYAALCAHPVGTEELSRQLGYSVGELVSRLGVLRGLRLIECSLTGWVLCRIDRRAAAAERLGISGRLQDRADRYCVERAAWAWWLTELAWMRAGRRTAASRRPGPDQLVLLDLPGAAPSLPAHPRRADGRADFPAARRALLTRLVAPSSDTGFLRRRAA